METMQTVYRPMQMDLFNQGNKKSNYSKFLEFHKQYPIVFSLFEKMSLSLIEQGLKKIGAKLVVEQIRFYKHTGSKDYAGFKINNNYTTYYGRMFIEKYPEFKELFEMRELKS